MAMIQFIVQYWVQWAFGIVALALAGLAKHYYSLYKKDKKHTTDEQLQEIHKDIENRVLESEKEMLEQMHEINKETQETTAKRYDELAQMLSNHEQDALSSYQSMFTSLTDQLNEFKAESDAQDTLIKEDLAGVHKGIDLLQGGVLNIQGGGFKAACRQLLAPDHVITEVEYEEIVNDHDIYKSLGGNHRGDELFSMVQEKYKKSL